MHNVSEFEKNQGTGKMWNYWKCRVYKRHAMKKKWVAEVIETGELITRCKKWKTAVSNAIGFQKMMNQKSEK